MAELQEYEEVRPVRRDEKHVYDDFKHVNKMDNVSSPSWKQYLKMFTIVIAVSLTSAIVTYFTVNAQIQQKLTLIDTRLAEIEKKNEETEKRNNLTFSHFEKKSMKTENRNNLTLVHLQKQIDDSTEQVAITAHPASTSTLQGIIKFDYVTFSVGINNLPTYKSTGKFVVEKEGLYMISVAIYSKTNDAYYCIYLNGNVISYTKIAHTSSPPSSMSHTGTVVVVRQLRPNDSLWVYFPGNYYTEGGVWSTLTIVKIK
ncbi:uncharacterized protein LOC134681185 isoform X2 [Mytilus trossulus]